MERVFKKIIVEGAHLVLICPGWRGTLPAFKAITTRHYTFPPGPTFLHEGRYLMPAPKWEVHALYINYPGMGPSNTVHHLRSPMSGGRPIPKEGHKHPRHQAVVAILAGATMEVEDKPPKTGRGECPLSTNIESNPGPPWDNMPARATNCLAYFVHTFIQRWNLAEFITHEDFFPPDPGPSGETPSSYFNMWQECTCVCQCTLLLAPQQGIRLLIRHVTICATLHAATGRGATLSTCGDVELNPGPSGPSGPHQYDIQGTIVPVICEDWDLGDWEFQGTNTPIMEGPSSGLTRLHPKDHEFSGIWGRCPECDLWIWLRGPHTALRLFQKRHPNIRIPLAPDTKPEVPLDHGREILRLLGYRDQEEHIPNTGRGFSLQSTGVEMNPGPADQKQGGRGRDLMSCGDVESNPGPTPVMDLDEEFSASSSMAVGRPRPSQREVKDDNTPSAGTPQTPAMPGPNPHFEVDLAHGGGGHPTSHGAPGPGRKHRQNTGEAPTGDTELPRTPSPERDTIGPRACYSTPSVLSAAGIHNSSGRSYRPLHG